MIMDIHAIGLLVSLTLIILSICILVMIYTRSKKPFVPGIYRVRYKRVGQVFFRSFKNVKGDGILFGLSQDGLVPARYFILSDDTRIEMPVSQYVFVFGPDRLKAIEEDFKRQGAPR